MLLPGIVFYIIFCYVPMYGIIIAFKNFMPLKGIWGSPWVGLEHFQNLFSSTFFADILKNTVWISLLKLVFGFPAPIILALMLNEIKNMRFKKVIQTVSYIPQFLSWVIILGISYSIFNEYYGVLSSVSQFLGFDYVDITKDPEYYRLFLVISHIWKTAGWGSILYLAALSGIDPNLYEAAEIDGAGRWRQLINITIPSIKQIIAIVLILSMGTLLTSDFEQIYLFTGTNPQLLDVADVFETYVYRMGVMQLNYSFPTAVGVFQSFFAMLLIIGTNWISKKLEYEGIW